jgi:class 3 adenylate cyclase
LEQILNLPNGTATFLFTDIEGSTKLWEQHPEAMRLALADLGGVDDIQISHVAEAIHYRSLDRNLWGR